MTIPIDKKITVNKKCWKRYPRLAWETWREWEDPHRITTSEKNADYIPPAPHIVKRPHYPRHKNIEWDRLCHHIDLMQRVKRRQHAKKQR